MVGRTAAGLDVWQKNAQERLRLRREALLKPPARRTEADVVLLETVLSRVKFVRELTMKTRMDLCKLTGYARHGAGETLFRQGDAGEFFYVVLSGSVDVFIRDPGGREHLVATLFNGDSFGELALLYNSPRAATVMCTQAGTVWTIDRSVFNMITVASNKCVPRGRAVRVSRARRRMLEVCVCAQDLSVDVACRRG